MKIRSILLSSIILCIFTTAVSAQVSRLIDDVQYGGSVRGTAGAGDNAPFWFTGNRYGLGAIGNYTALGRAYIKRDIEADSLRFWKVGYGVDIAAGYGNQSYFNIQQAYFEAGWKMLALSLGQKERPSELKNPELTSGGLVLGMNARPIPQVRLEMPDFWAIPGTKGIFSFKAHIAYGWYTDNSWQKEFNSGTDNIYTRNSWFHSKSLFLRLGNHKRFPLVFTMGLEMACQFKGFGYNIRNYGGKKMDDGPLGGNIWTAFVPGSGGDVNDFATFQNSAGNHIGSYHFRLDWNKRNWSLGLYMEHMFEDQSQMFLQYGPWKDMLLGIEANLPANPYLSTALFEYNSTMSQTGPIYHDRTPENELQISGKDSYYDNHIYGSWQHAGFMMGNPTILSPLYNSYFGYSGSLHPYHNRTRTYHIGLSGDPCSQLHWCAKYTRVKSLGTYDRPVMDPVHGNFILFETKYSPKQVKGLSFTVAYGHNDGTLLGNSNAGMLTIAWDAWIRKTDWR